MQEWTEEVLESNKTLFLCFSFCMFKNYDMVRKHPGESSSYDNSKI